MARLQRGLRPNQEVKATMNDENGTRRNVTGLEWILKQGAPELHSSLTNLSKQLEEVRSFLVRSIPPEVTQAIRDFAIWSQNNEKLRDIMEQTGWLPYPGVESYLSDVGQDMNLAAQRYEKFVDEQWPSIRVDMEARLAQSDTDEETKATFREALQAHESGLYRSVCRCLLPEMERALRVKVGILDRSFKFKESLESVVDQGEFHHLFGDNPYGLSLFPELQDFLFKSVANEKQRTDMESHLNRHIAVHGLSPYNTKQRSFNALVLALYLFLLLSHEEEPEESAVTAQ